MTSNEKWHGNSRSGSNSGASRDGKPFEKRDVKSILKGSRGAAKFSTEKPNYHEEQPQQGEKLVFKKRDDSRPAFGDRKPYENRGNSSYGERKPYENREGRPSFGNKKPYENRGNSFNSDRKPYENRGNSSYGERKPYENGEGRPSFGDRKPYGNRDDRPSFGERKPYGERDNNPSSLW